MADPQRVVFLDRGTIPTDILLRPPAFQSALIFYDKTSPHDIADRIAGATVVITNKVRIGRRELENAPSLRLIVVAATGTDCVDVSACDARDIMVCNIRNYATQTVPEHVFALLLSLRRSIAEYRQSVRTGRWQEAGQFCYFDHPVSNLAGSTLGIIGAGVLGQEVARLAKAFRINVLFAGRKGSAIPGLGRTHFDDVLAQSDAISLHLPLTDGTRGLIGATEFKKMARCPILINTARGPLIDEPALLNALEQSQIAGAGIDVAMPEPPPADGFLMRISQHPNAIVTPHIAWAGRQSIRVLADQVVDLIDAWSDGHPFNVVGKVPEFYGDTT